MKKTTLCYILCGDEILMLHRTKKKNDENEGKYIGLGGHFLEGESPFDCVKREVLEESGILLQDPSYRGIVTFQSNVYPSEEMHLFTATLPSLPPLPECDEGELKLISKDRLLSLKMWEGDLIFLSLLFENQPFFELTLCYEGETLTNATLNGRPSELFDLLDEKGERTGRFKERSLVHRDGDFHATAHVWIYRTVNGRHQLLLQKRAQNKDAYPGMLDISCAGHLKRGDSYEEAAARELEEELGLGAFGEDLKHVGFYERYTKEVFYNKPFLDHERSALYLLCGNNIRPEQIVCSEELCGVCWFDVDLLEKDHTLGGQSCLVKEELSLVLSALKNIK
ncbi:MAG: NUDIX domain-containing protein [Clostridia bacterium]|nr:NUDIX domain-containing protein [Clostridia bacterium]